jgi:hypothetical protein
MIAQARKRSPFEAGARGTSDVRRIDMMIAAAMAMPCVAAITAS